MYSAPRQDNVTPRGTGVFYQALPAIGADGRNIMTLIPVQMVNGKCIQSDVVIKRKPWGNVSTPGAFGIKTAVTPLAMKQSAGNQVSLVNVLPCQLGVVGQALELGISLNTHPLRTVEPQAFHRPPESQVQTVSVSEGRSGIKKQLLMLSTNSLSSSDSTSVRTVSSQTTACQSNVSSCASERKTFFSTSPMTSLPVEPPKSRLKLIPKVSQRPDSPMKWVIEEVNSNESAVDPPHPPPLPSKTFPNSDSSNKLGLLEKVVPVSLAGVMSETHHHQDLVMCDGRVFFAAKKDALSSPAQSTKKSCQLESTVSSSLSSHLQRSKITIPKEPNEVIDLTPKEPNQVIDLTPKEPNQVIDLTPKKPNEVIDLCTDENSDDLSQTLQTYPTLDEDNVIFVSYIPAKSGNVPMQSLVEKTLENETSTMTLDYETQHRRAALNCSDTAHDQLMYESSIGRRQKPDQSMMSSSNARPVSISSDHLLRQMFGITSDVRICLQKINPGSSGLGLNEPAQKETANLLKESELFMQYCYNPQDPDRSSSSVDNKRAKLSGEIVTSSPHAGLMVGYLEPIDDDDLPNSDENDTPNSQDSAAPSLNSARSNTSRMGRARKRTMCSCCVPGTPGQAVKTATGVEESQRLTWTRDHTSKRSRR